MKKERNSVNTNEMEPKKEEEATKESLDLEEEFQELKKERDEYLDQLLRTRAEFENYRRRVEREKRDIAIAAQAELIREVLLIMDACEKGLESFDRKRPEPLLKSFRQGYELLLKQLQSVLEKYEVTQAPGVGEPFDPNIHEAVNREVTEESPEGQILEEYRKGYLFKNRLLRPSHVKVAVSPAEGAGDKEEPLDERS